MGQLFTGPALEPPALNDHHHVLVLILNGVGDDPSI